MTRFLICSFALVLLYPAGIDMYLVGLPRIAADLQVSEAQLHIAFSVYLAGMATAMLFAGKVADQSGRKPVAIVGAPHLYFRLRTVFFCRERNAIPGRPLYSGRGRRLLLCGGLRYSARHARRSPPGKSAVAVERNHLYRTGAGSGDGASDYAQIPVAKPVLHDDRYGCGRMLAVGIYPARITPSDPHGVYTKEPHQRVFGEPFFLKPSGHYHSQRVGDPDLREYLSGVANGSDGLRPRRVRHHNGHDRRHQYGGLFLHTICSERV